jgi:DcmR-like sensory protein
MAQRLETLEVGNHVIAVYSTKEEKFKEAFAFLKEGHLRNEVVVITTTDLPKDEIRARMTREWNVDVLELESKGDVIIKTTEEIYFPDGVQNIPRTMALWSTLVENSLNKGKRGLRVVGNMAAFFRNGFTKELLEYESCLEQRFDFPAIGICAYDSVDIENMTLEQLRQLRERHEPVWMDD